MDDLDMSGAVGGSHGQFQRVIPLSIYLTQGNARCPLCVLGARQSHVPL